MINKSISRREFGKQVAAAGAALTLGSMASKLNAAADLPIGIQLYSVRDALAKDFKGTLAQVAKIGYKHFEFAGYGGMEAAELDQFVKSLGATVCGTHEGYEGLVKDTAAVLAFNKTIGNKMVVVPSMPGNVSRGGVAEIEKFAQTLNTFGAEAKKQGMQICYHNHSFEFKKIDGERTIFDVLFSAADKDLVKSELDVAWVAAADVDPVALMKRYKGRIAALHMKDLDSDKKLAPVGEGVIDMKKVIKAARKIGVEWYIVEQDSTRKGKDIMDEIAISYNNLAKLLS
jgi:sugar phosphate isomerase/epimerase